MSTKSNAKKSKAAPKASLKDLKVKKNGADKVKGGATFGPEALPQHSRN